MSRGQWAKPPQWAVDLAFDITRAERPDVSRAWPMFICHPCRAGDHDKCRGPVWCDCQHGAGRSGQCVS